MPSLRLSFSLLLPSPGLSTGLLFWVPSQPALLPSWDCWEACWELGRQQELCSAPGHPPATPKLSTTRGWGGVGADPTLPSVPDPAVPAAPEAEDLPGAWQDRSPSSGFGVAPGTGRAVGWQGQGAGGWLGCCSWQRGSDEAGSSWGRAQHSPWCSRCGCGVGAKGSVGQGHSSGSSAARRAQRGWGGDCKHGEQGRSWGRVYAGGRGAWGQQG